MTSPDRPCSPADVPDDITLAEFYLARLAEIERDARLVKADLDQTPKRLHLDIPAPRAAAVGRHLDVYAPARVLRDVQAKRRIVEQCAAVLAEFDRRDTWGAWPDFGPKHLAEDVLAQLAEVYADHPDYREEWRP